MKICGTNVGEFVAWRENELVFETVPIDGYVLTVALEKVTIFNIYGILLEVLYCRGKRFCLECSKRKEILK